MHGFWIIGIEWPITLCTLHRPPVVLRACIQFEVVKFPALLSLVNLTTSNYMQARSQEFFEGGLRPCLMCMYASEHARKIGVLGGCPQRIFEIRCFEIASGAIFGQKQSHSRLPFHPIFGLVPYICETSWLQISMKEGTKVSRTIDNRAIIYGRTVGGVTSTEIQLVNSRAPIV